MSGQFREFRVIKKEPWKVGGTRIRIGAKEENGTLCTKGADRMDEQGNAFATRNR